MRNSVRAVRSVVHNDEGRLGGIRSDGGAAEVMVSFACLHVLSLTLILSFSLSLLLSML